MMVRRDLWVQHKIKLHTVQLKWSIVSRRIARKRLAFIQLDWMRRNMEVPLADHKIASTSDEHLFTCLSFFYSFVSSLQWLLYR